jgi:hypothetical protein
MLTVPKVTPSPARCGGAARPPGLHQSLHFTVSGLPFRRLSGLIDAWAQGCHQMLVHSSTSTSHGTARRLLTRMALDGRSVDGRIRTTSHSPAGDHAPQLPQATLKIWKPVGHRAPWILIRGHATVLAVLTVLQCHPDYRHDTREATDLP